MNTVDIFAYSLPTTIHLNNEDKTFKDSLFLLYSQGQEQCLVYNLKWYINYYQ